MHYAALALLLSHCGSWILLEGSKRGWHWIPKDSPNDRSLHQHAVPRCGGLAVGGALIATCFAAGVLRENWAAAYALLVLISYLDDRRSLTPIARLVMHFLAAWVFLSDRLELGPMLLDLLVIVAITNLTNFMDGANGLVSGVVSIAAAVLAFTAVGSPETATMLFVLAGALLGFLPFNWRDGRMFLGDSGSVPVGFLLATQIVSGARTDIWSPAMFLLPIAPLYLDAICTLLVRLAKGERVWQAHRSHLYQRLVQAGWSHRRVASAYIAFTCIAAAIGYSARHADDVIQITVISMTAILGCVTYLCMTKHLASAKQPTT